MAKRDLFYEIKDVRKDETLRTPLFFKDIRKEFALVELDYNDPKYRKAKSYHRSFEKASIAKLRARQKLFASEKNVSRGRLTQRGLDGS